ncbi:hypothetical protein HUU05_09705 [candidate division KSB1 bacterium]|nr:hypothetical protein [candidate division KSB1 bacterium]
MNARTHAKYICSFVHVKFSVAALFLSVFVVNAFCQDQHLYLTTNTLVARPLALGGAYVAAEDALAAGLYNPANAGGYRLDRSPGFQLFLNPLTPALALSQTSSFFNKEEKTFAQTLATLGLLLKGITLRAGPFDLSAIVGEQATSYTLLSEKKWETVGYFDNQYNVLALRMRLADRVSVGGSVGLYYIKSPNAKQRTWKVLASYGIALAPSRTVLIGVSYLTVPARGMDNQRDHPERIVTSSVNLGLSYRPQPSTTVSFDLRNVVEDGGSMVRREPHWGLEYGLFSLLALRLGAFYKLEDKQAAISAGIGLLDLNWPRARAAHAQYSHWAINYGIVGERTKLGDHRFIHALTVAFRI